LTVTLAAYCTLMVSGAVRAAGAGEIGSIHGTVSLGGTVEFSGAVPEPEPIDMAADEYCESAQEGKQVLDRPIEVDENGFLRDVVVHVKEGLQTGALAAPEQSELLDQKGCLYAPRSLAVRAGQTLVIRNSDETLHNVNVTAQANRGFNIGQPIKGIEAKRSFDEPELGIRVACDIHGWMHASISVFDHPYFDVTAPGGAFSIEGLPPGDYVVEAWHPVLGTTEASVQVPATGSAEIRLTFEGGSP
jgi:plastocyanin